MEENSAIGAELEAFRPYLQIMAESQLFDRLKSKVDAADIVQQTLVQAYQARDQYRGQSSAERAAWLRTILNNVLLATAREFSRQRRDINREHSMQAIEQSSMHLTNLLIATTSSPSAALHRQELANQLAHAMLALTSDQRQAVMLKYWEGLTLVEISQRLEKSTEAVAGLIFRAMQKLRGKIDELAQ
jgi:RNA polymerase sigma-70 factor (ECF subfamily)